MIKTYNEDKKEKHKADITTAFYSAYFSRLKELSNQNLIDVLDKIDNEEMTDEDMFNAVKRMAGR